MSADNLFAYRPGQPLNIPDSTAYFTAYSDARQRGYSHDAAVLAAEHAVEQARRARHEQRERNAGQVRP